MSKFKGYEKRRNGFDDDDWNDNEYDSDYKKESIRQKRREKFKRQDEFMEEETNTSRWGNRWN